MIATMRYRSWLPIWIERWWRKPSILSRVLTTVLRFPPENPKEGRIRQLYLHSHWSSATAQATYTLITLHPTLFIFKNRSRVYEVTFPTNAKVDSRTQFWVCITLRMSWSPPHISSKKVIKYVYNALYNNGCRHWIASHKWNTIQAMHRGHQQYTPITGRWRKCPRRQQDIELLDQMLDSHPHLHQGGHPQR